MLHTDSTDPDSIRLDLDELTRHIVQEHHDYVRRITPTIDGWLEKLAHKHAGRYPELTALRSTFATLSARLASHMLKEENILFPYVDLLASIARTGAPLPSGPFGTIVNPIRVMEDDHRECEEEMATVRRLAHSYQPPADACTTHRLCFAELARFEADLHRHIRLEDQTLFPRAIDLERQLL